MNLLVENLTIRPQIKYKRVIWGGKRNTEPTIFSNLHEGTIQTIYDFLIKDKYEEDNVQKLFPCLIIWQNNNDELGYLHVGINRKPKNSDSY